MYGLEWDHAYYGARDLQQYNYWDSGSGDEYFCADPVVVTDLTTSVLSLLPKRKSICPEALNLASLGLVSSSQIPILPEISTLCGSSPSPQRSRLEELPVEILHQILSYLPLALLLRFRRISKYLTSRLCLDQHFWLRGMVSGTLIPHLWDLDQKECSKTNRENLSKRAVEGSVNDSQWDWEGLIKLLTSTNSIMEARDIYGTLPIGFRNRCRIWKIIEEAMAM